MAEKYLHVNPAASELHENGLLAELGHEFDAAQTLFNEALICAGDEPPSVDRSVHMARIQRDSGFSYLREAIDKQDALTTAKAARKLSVALRMTAPFINGTSDIQPAEGRHGTPKQARREVFGEHGATMSCYLGRFVTARQVMEDVDTRGDSPRAIKAREEQQYGLAHDILRIGNKGYERVSNAMCGARQEVINGRSQQAGAWVGRAAFGLLWTAAHDPGNLKRSVLTVGSRSRHLRSYKAAKKSVLTHP